MGTSAGSAPLAGGRLAVVGDRVFDARSGAWADGTVVLVEDGLISGVSRAAPDGWPVLVRPGASLLPGLIDAHTHVLLRSSYDEFELARQMTEENLGHRAASAVQAMSISVRHGFTTIRDLGTEGPATWMSACGMPLARAWSPGRGCGSQGPPFGRPAAIHYPASGTA